jgi:hypothetical protein
MNISLTFQDLAKLAANGKLEKDRNTISVDRPLLPHVKISPDGKQGFVRFTTDESDHSRRSEHEPRGGNSLQITLEGHYANAHDETLKLECQSITEVAARYTRDTSADGTVMMSEIEPRAVQVRGINVETLQTLNWQPNRLLFEDPTTGELKDLPVYSVEINGPGMVNFSIHD